MLVQSSNISRIIKKSFCLITCIIIGLSSAAFARCKNDHLLSERNKHPARKQGKAENRLEKVDKKPIKVIHKKAKKYEIYPTRNKNNEFIQGRIQTKKQSLKSKQKPPQLKKLSHQKQGPESLNLTSHRKRSRGSSNHGYYDPQSPYCVKEKPYYLRARPFSLKFRSGRKS